MINEEITIRCSDGFLLGGTLFTPENTPAGAVIIASAMGVPRKFYRPFASYLAVNGFASIIFDYRGIGDSRNGANIEEIALEDWGRFDIDAALREAIERFNPKFLYLIGHSCGGQLFGLAPHSERLSGVVLTAAQLANWRLWPSPLNIGMFALWYFFIPAMSMGRRMFPARRLGIASIDVPKGVTSQWAQWGRQTEYLFSDKFNIDTARYSKFTFPLLSYAFDDDIYAPPEAVKALLAKIPNAKIETAEIKASVLGAGKIGHFGFYKEKMNATLWPRTLAWLNRISGHL
jgi:predicted alpha/beta hydrolase